MADSEMIHVAVAPPANLDANLVRSVAAVIDKSPYDTRLVLTGEIPKINLHRFTREKDLDPDPI